MGNVERAIRDSDLGVNPANDGKVLRCVFPELTEERRKEYIKVAAAQGRGGPGRGPQPASSRQAAAGEAGEGRRGRQGRRDRCREAARLGDQEAHRRHRRPAQAQGVRAARGLSARPRDPSPAPMTTDHTRARAGPRARRTQRAGLHRQRRGAGRADPGDPAVLEDPLHGGGRRRRAGRDLGAAPRLRGQRHRPARAAADGRRRRDGRRRLLLGRPGAGHRDRGQRAGDDALAAAPRRARLRRRTPRRRSSPSSTSRSSARSSP